ncbi:MAG: hypothetical protein OQK82_01910 [Candidatus Pacearchaeota archaeon]|nr:hypothetical protein [Candidatus Pacearchaeota archaeon]
MQSYTPKGRVKTCPWISLRGKEWKALSEMRDALNGLLAVQVEMVEQLKELVEVERQKIHIQEQIKN